MGICNPLSTHTYVAARTWRSHPSLWVLLFSCKDAEKPYSAWEKGLFVVCLALQEAKTPVWQQLIILWRPFKVCKPVSGTSPSPHFWGITQRDTVWKQYAWIDHYCHSHKVIKGAPTTFQIQEKSAKQPDLVPPPSCINLLPFFKLI